jgi:CII-binding regulator of phage lambda lysogenization HflD
MAGGVAGAQGQQSNALGYLLNSLFTGNQPSTIDRIFGGAPAQNDNLFQQLWKMMNSGNNTSYQDYQ